MVKLARQSIDRFLEGPDGKFCAALIFGRDEGLVRERANRLARAIVPDPNDPFRIADIEAGELRQNPARLADEAAAIAMTGGRRLVRLTNANDHIARTLGAFLEAPVGDGFVLVTAGDLAPRSNLRKTVEAAARAAAIACYPDEGKALDDLITRTLAAHDLVVTPDALAYLAGHLGSDRLVSRGELEKLALYKSASPEAEPETDETASHEVTLADALACIGDSAALSLDQAVDAACSGNISALDLALRRSLAAGTSPITVIRALARRLRRLDLAAGHAAAGLSPDEALRRLRPPAFRLEAAALRHQLAKWPAPRLRRALEMVLEAEVACKLTGAPQDVICARTCFRLAAAVRM